MKVGGLVKKLLKYFKRNSRKDEGHCEVASGESNIAGALHRDEPMCRDCETCRRDRETMKEDLFINVLIEKLNRVKRDQEVREKLEKTLQQFCAYNQNQRNAVKLKKAKTVQKVHWQDIRHKEKRKMINPLPESQGIFQSNRSHARKTVVGYCFGQNSVPFMTRVAGQNITLGHFKAIFNRKGYYRFFFKKYCNEFGTRTVFEEITDDEQVLPLWENKVFAIVEQIDSYKL